MQARELASFQSLIVDEATRDNQPSTLSTELRCRIKKCKSNIEVAFDGDVIEWWCRVCNKAAGSVTGRDRNGTIENKRFTILSGVLDQS